VQCCLSFFKLSGSLGCTPFLSVASQLQVCSDESIQIYNDWHAYVCSGDPYEKIFW